MLFNSFQFAVFLPVVLAIYYLLSHRAQNVFLLFASCFFYACWDWRFLAPLLISTSIDYYAAYKMEDLIRTGEPAERRKRYLVLSVVTNLGLLGFFKYFNFFTASMRDLIGELGWQADPYMLEIILPVGISFYTFQALSYTIDVYRGELHATRNFFDFLLAVLYFPHLVAGPIQRAHNLLAQVVTPRVITRQKITDGLHLIFWGFFKKVFIADNVAPIADQVFSMQSPDGFHTLMGAYAFAVQIYCDFSGYTDIARGVAKLMGFEFVLNFNLPYFATNPSEFWSRWHISLSTWLRDYLYIPLGGNRHGVNKTYRNLMLTMVIGGLWHGAAWNFVLWGFYHGTILILHRVLSPVLDKIFTAATPAGRAFSLVFRILFMFHLTCYGWLLFRATSFNQIWEMTLSLLQPFQVVDTAMALQIALYSAPLFLVQLIQFFSKKLHFLDFRWIPAEARVVCYSIFTYFILFRGGEQQAFIYFQF
ncbi:MAG: MBOAT family O-acyltransferase [Bryobacteraceae bacterium]